MRLQRLSRALALAIGLASSVLFAYLAVRHVEWGRFWSALSQSHWLWLLPAAAVLGAGVALRACRWQFLFRPQTRPPFVPTLRALLIGTCLNALLPARPGEAIRVLALHEEAGTSRAEALGTAVTERLFDVAALLTLLFVAIPWLPELTWLHRAALAAAVLGTGFLTAVVALARWEERPLRFLLSPLVWVPGISRDTVDRGARSLVAGLTAMRRVRIALPALGLTVVSILVITTSFWLVLRAARLDLPFGAAVLTMVATNLAMVIPSSPAAVGVFEAAVLVAMRPFHVSPTRALSYGVVLHALNVVPFVVLGIALMHRQGFRVLRRPATQI